MSASRSLSAVEQALATCLSNLQQRVAKRWAGWEKEALIALVRTLDYAAVTGAWESSEGDDAEARKRRRHRTFVRMGATAAFRPLLSAVKGRRGGVPMLRNTHELARFANSYLLACGQLTFLSRIAALERYGLASTEFLGPGHIRIEATAGAPEQAALDSVQFLAHRAEQAVPKEDTEEEKRWERLHARMESYVDSSNEWFIQYDNDWDIVLAYREEAQRFGLGFLESEALPDDVRVGDRSFGEWKQACEQALGRILAHIDFAALLKKKRPSTVLSETLTLFARRDDVVAIWEEAGLAKDRIDPTLHALTLESDGLDDWDLAFESPTPFYVDFGRDFVLQPCFGALANPYFALFRHLRRAYKTDWDRGVDRREVVFREDLARMFPAPRFVVPSRGCRLYRDDGSQLTDIDAVVIDRDSGSVALVQLKWHDVFGFSLGERESRRRNIEKANEWVDRVSTWVNGRSSKDVLTALHLESGGSDGPPLLYVVARYTARFSGDQHRDERASWLGWWEICHTIEEEGFGKDPLNHLPEAALARQRQFECPPLEEAEFQFPGLKATSRMPVSA